MYLVAALMAQSCAPAPLLFDSEDRGDRQPEWTEPPPGPDPLDLGGATADARLVAESAHDLVGWSLASAGDVDGDGYDDVLVGAPGRAEGGGKPGDLGSAAGAAYLLRGPVTSTTTAWTNS